MKFRKLFIAGVYSVQLGFVGFPIPAYPNFTIGLKKARIESRELVGLLGVKLLES